MDLCVLGMPGTAKKSGRVVPPKALRDGIAALRNDHCFYCGETLGSTPEADHFIPRIRCGIDAIENLVLADRRCDNDKRNLLPSSSGESGRAG